MKAGHCLIRGGEILNSIGDTVGFLKENFELHVNNSGNEFRRFGESEPILFLEVTVVSKLQRTKVVEVD